jgi:ABC-type polysaccharide/polyol phosphate export permease
MLKTLRELTKYRELVYYLVATSLKTRYRDSWLGFLWTLLNPLLLMLVLWTVFSRMGQFNQSNYALFLLSGIVVWNFFSQSLEAGLESVVQYRSLIQKIYVPKIVFPVSVVTSNLVNLLFFLLAYLLIALVTDGGFQRTLPWIFPSLLMVYLLAMGAALFMATANVFYRDFSHLTQSLVRMLFYLTPIFYPASFLGPKVEMFLKLNPVYYVVETARSVLYYGIVSSWQTWVIGFAMAIGVFMLGLKVFVSYESKFIYYA